jgi:hypothetical protein
MIGVRRSAGETYPSLSAPHNADDGHNVVATDLTKPADFRRTTALFANIIRTAAGKISLC